MFRKFGSNPIAVAVISINNPIGPLRIIVNNIRRVIIEIHVFL